ncbi:unnamed protein product [Strongylus vulgaris]|uniref:Uncharacterized protein n=1 Tax=Strongylus vulgaris TaxID=40348 RepID=A0A3P7JFB6_STRVU|nr:unnamed protein product [Strongylus vulgaris]
MLLVYDFFWYTEVIHIALMAVNRLDGYMIGTCRFVAILFPTYYATIFSCRNMLYFLAFCYFLGISVNIPLFFPCCCILWDSFNYIAFYADPESW